MNALNREILFQSFAVIVERMILCLFCSIFKQSKIIRQALFERSQYFRKLFPFNALQFNPKQFLKGIVALFNQIINFELLANSFNTHIRERSLFQCFAIHPIFHTRLYSNTQNRFQNMCLYWHTLKTSFINQ